MKVWIDGQEHREIASSAPALEVLEAVRGEAARSGLVLTGIRVDGVEMDENAFLALSGGMAAHFTLTPVRVLVQESLTEALDYVSRLKKGLEEIAGHLESGETSAAQGKLSNAMDGLDWVLGVYERCSALAAAPFAEEEEQAFRDTLLSTLNRLVELMDGKKYLQMALILRQELLPSVNALALKIGRLSEPRTRTQ